MVTNNNDNIGKLYSALKNEGFEDLGDEKSFADNLADVNKRKRLYDVLVSEGYEDIGTIDEFSSRLGFGEQKTQNTEQEPSGSEIITPAMPGLSINKNNAGMNAENWQFKGNTYVDAGRNANEQFMSDPSLLEHQSVNEKGFWGTYTGDLLQRLGSGLQSAVGNVFGLVDKGERAVNDALIAMGVGAPVLVNGGAFTLGPGKTVKGFAGKVGDAATAHSEELRKKSDRYNGESFVELADKGDVKGAVGEVFLTATESLPLSLAAMFGGGAGLAGIGAVSANQKYDELSGREDLNEVQKTTDAVLTGTFEALSEHLGSVPIGKWLKSVYRKKGKDVAEDQLRKGLSGWLKKHFKDYGVLYAPIAEGIEEVSSQIATNITDRVLGVSDANPMDGVLESFVYGAAGGAQFSAVGVPGVIYTANQKRQIKRKFKEKEDTARQLLGDQFDQFDASLAKLDNDQKKLFIISTAADQGIGQEGIESLMDYAAYKNKFEYYIQQVEYKISEQQRAAIEEIDSKSNKKMGALIVANIVGSDAPVNIVGGEVYYDEDGNVDVQKSDAILYYIDAEGNRKMIASENVKNVLDYIPAEAAYAEAMANARQGVASKEEVEVNDDLVPGAVVQTSNGTLLTVVENDGSGNIVVSDQFGITSQIPAIELSVMQSSDQVTETARKTELETGLEAEEQEMQPAQPTQPPTSDDASVQPVEIVQPTPQVPFLDQVPKDEKGNMLFEHADQAITVGALREVYDDEVEVREAVDAAINRLTNEFDMLENPKPTGDIQQDIINKKKAKEAAKVIRDRIAYWQAVKEEIAKEFAEQKGGPSIESQKTTTEATTDVLPSDNPLEGVPDIIEDNPQDARDRGYRRVNGHKIDRQDPLSASKGKAVQIRFGADQVVDGNVAVIDVSQLQPSHIQGVRNPLHFIDEAQPKERNDKASEVAAQKMAASMRPEEITSSATAYSGAPVVNSRGEAIQGNNRSYALRIMWNSNTDQAESYKKYLIDHATEFGLNPEDIAAMDMPVLVNMVDVPDSDAITLGQYVAQDTESGGIERIKPKNIMQKMGGDVKSFANKLLQSTDDESSLSMLIDRNGVEVLKWMNRKGYITDTQYSSAFDSKGNITAEAKNDLRGIIYQSIFKGSNTTLEEMFNSLPAKAQKAILATAYRDYDSPDGERMMHEIQNSIRAYYALSRYPAFAEAKTFKDVRLAVESWKSQYQLDDATGESYLPASNYSNFSLLLAAMYKGEKQSVIQGRFNELYDIIQGVKASTIFEKADNTPHSLADAIKEIFNIEYNGQRRDTILARNNQASEQRESRVSGSAETGERIEGGNEPAIDRGDTQRDSETSGLEEVPASSIFDTKDYEGKELFHGSPDGGLTMIDPYAHTNNWREGIGFYTTESRSKADEYANGRTARGSRKSGKGGVTSVIFPTGAKVLDMDAKADSDMWNELASNLDVTDPDVTGSNMTAYNSLIDNYNDEKGGEGQYAVEEALKSKGFDASTHIEGKESTPHRVFIWKNERRLPAIKNSDSPKKQEIKQAEAETETNPTDAQKQAGNYKKGHIKVQGFGISIEQPKGSVRSGVDRNGNAWSVTMNNTYGYIRNTEGKDGDHIDVFIGENPESTKVFVVDQVNPDGSFDEHKVMLGFDSIEEAKESYLSNYSEGWQGLGNITETDIETFRDWAISDTRRIKPFAEYRSVQNASETRTETTLAETEEPTTAEKGKKSSSAIKIDDFGEKIGGARKDIAEDYKKKADEANKGDFENRPLSEVFPRPNFKKMVEEGVLSESNAAVLSVLYDDIPVKPRLRYRLPLWVNKVKEVVRLYNAAIGNDNINYLDPSTQREIKGSDYNYFKNGEPYKLSDQERLYKNPIWLKAYILKQLGFPASDVKGFKGVNVEYQVFRAVNIFEVSIGREKGRFKTIEEAIDYINSRLSGPTKRETVFNVYQNRASKKYYIGKPMKGRAPIRMSELFDTSEEAFSYLKTERDKIQAKWDAMNINPEERRSENRERKGRDWRNGKDVTPQMFQDTFRFRGTEFGKWVNQEERQDALNDAYDALMDLASALEVSPKALSLNGELAIAFGARGRGNAGGSTAKAHYEPDKVVINLTKTKGAGSLAHEWWHALDNYFSRQGGDEFSYATEGNGGRIRQKVRESFEDIVDVINKSGLIERSRTLDKTKNTPYWSTIIEMSARSFENFVLWRMSEQGNSNDYLVNFKKMEEWIESGMFDQDTFPYPTKEESHLINEKFQQLFDTVQEAVDEETGNVKLYRDSIDRRGNLMGEVEDIAETIRNEVETLANELNTPIRIVTDTEMLPNGTRQRRSKGWYDTETGEVVIVIPNIDSVEDAQATVLHEIVAHKGLRDMLGDKFNSMMDAIYKNLPDDVRKEVAISAIRSHSGNIRVATEEYLASIAEQGVEDPGTWNKIKSAVKDFFRSLGIDIQISDADIAYLLWKSKNRLQKGDSPINVINKTAQDANIKSRLFRDNPDINPITLQNYDEETQAEIINQVEQFSKEERDQFSALLQAKHNRLREGYQDRMLPVKLFQQLLENKFGKTIPDFANIYLNENSLISRSTHEVEYFTKNILQPILDEVAKIKEGRPTSYVNNYLIAKHGLERNAYMRSRELEAFKEKTENKLKENIEALNNKLYEFSRQKDVTRKQIDSETKKTDAAIDELNQKAKEAIAKEELRLSYKDYSGLTAITQELDPSMKGMNEDLVRDYVAAFESNHDTSKLWELINKANKASLKKLFMSGYIDKATHDNIESMYENYVPLRNWDEQTAGDLYDYYYKDRNEGVNNAMKSAGGRKSKAGDVLANIASMYESSVFIGNKNVEKQHLLRLVRNFKSNLAVVGEQWYRNIGTKEEPEWMPVTPKGLTENEEQNVAIIQEFEDEMKALQEEGLAKKGRDKLGLGVPVLPYQAEQHIVKVKENGKEKLIYFNCDPSVAQSVNGLNNVKVYDNKIISGIIKVKHFMARNFTTRNPAFVIRNLSRDMIYATSMHGVREGAGYTAEFLKTIPEASGAISRSLRGVRGTSQEQQEMDRLYEEFVKFGGRTGFVALTSYEQYKKKISRAISRLEHTNKLRDGFIAIGEFFGMCNNWAEDLSRFSTYVTSIRQGRSVTQAVKDAKEVTVNFNRKGSGAMGNIYFDSMYLFFNAGMQGMYNFASTAKQHPKRTSMVVASWAALGFMANIMTSLIFGDDDDYNDLPDYLRQNNLVLPFDIGGVYVCLPLPIELRAFYGIGDMVAQYVKGEYKGRDFSADFIEKIMDLTPKNFMGENSDNEYGLLGSAINNLTPDAVRPLVDAYLTNTNFFGSPVTYRNEWNKDAPEYTKVLKGTSTVLTKASEYANTLSGGDYATKGWADSWLLNPAAVEYIFEQYVGGVGKTINQTVKTLASPITGDFELRNTPVISGFTYSNSNPMPRNSYMERYKSYVEKLEKIESRERRYKQGIKKGMDLSENYAEMKKGDDMREAFITKMFKTKIDDLKKMASDLPLNEREQIYDQIEQLTKMMLNEIDKLQ